MRIDVQESHADKNPIVVSFPGGMPQALMDTNGASVDNATKIKDAVSDSSDGDSDDDVVISPKFTWNKLSAKSAFGRRIIGRDKNCVYTSASRGIGYDERSTKLCVGVYDKKRGIVKLYEAASKGTVYTLSQSVPHYTQQISSSLLDPNAPKNDDIDKSNANNSYQAVFEDFGSAKKRKVLKSQTANQVDIDHVVGASSQAGKGGSTPQSAMMENVITGSLSMSESNRKALEESMRMTGSDVAGIASGMVTSNAVNAAHAESRKRWLPKYDEKAAKPSLVYSAKDIAGVMAWNRLLREINNCRDDEDSFSADSVVQSIDENNWCDSAKEVVRKEIAMGSKSVKDRLVVTLLLNWFLQFYINNHTRKSIQKPDKTKSYWFGMPVEVATRCIELFTSPTSGRDGTGGFFVISDEKKNKCMIHILLLYIMSHGPTMRVKNISPVAKDLKISVNDASTKLRQAGCTIGKTGGSIGAVLKVPLTFPSPKKRGGGARR